MGRFMSSKRPSNEVLPPEALVRAAGGVLWRAEGSGPWEAALEVLVAHRPRYDDWSFPKGKLDPGESDEECAVREVHEETGLVCVLGPELPTVEYEDRKGRPKTVRYWGMTLCGSDVRGCGTAEPDFEPNDEVDEVMWLPLEDAHAILTYPVDQALLLELAPTLRDAGAAPGD